MKSDLTDLKKLTLELMQNGTAKVQENNKSLIQKIYGNSEEKNTIFEQESKIKALSKEEEIEEVEQEEFLDDDDDFNNNYLYAETIDETETLSLEAKEIELIKKSLEKNKGKRKAAADELGISERTLYRKIKQFDL
jgi:DNA-binding NtrC family response regulator